MNRIASLGFLAPLFAAGLIAAGCADAPTASEASFSGKPSNHDARLTCQSSTMGTITLRVQAGQDSLSGFTVQWVSESMHDSTGNWDSAATANFAVPNFALAPGASVSVTVGDPFSLLGATGDTTDLACGTTYHFRLITRDSTGALDTGAVVECTTAPCDDDDDQQDSTEECTRGLGWWKNHLDEWPVDSLTIGDITYSKAQLLQILSAPIRGSKLQILARKLIVAKLNVERTGDTTSSVLDAIDALDSAIGNRRIPPVGNGTLNDRRLERFADLLEQFNEGDIGPGDCEEMSDDDGDSDDDQDDDDDDDDEDDDPREGPGNNGRGHAWGHMLRGMKGGR